MQALIAGLEFFLLTYGLQALLLVLLAHSNIFDILNFFSTIPFVRERSPAGDFITQRVGRLIFSYAKKKLGQKCFFLS